ncbi:VTC domain-containing protein [Pseudofrankia saprophytica]|uniref:VTC domain-containing protein n=1 Tax=Pseudofrankia saprophytica TaxID=298655 RepID=UPI000234CA61|nr:VTC domain-containing protein [Pseudofrankia saprophytica]
MKTTGRNTSIDAFPPIELDELVERAELLRRVDHKYVLPSRDLPALLESLAVLGGVRVLEIDGRRELDYRSVYFDTPNLDSYLGAARGRRRRFKLRTRSYLDTGARYLEVKTRCARGATVKQRTPYWGDTHHLDARARAYTDAVLAAAGIRVEHLRFDPALISAYRRSTLFIPSAAARVTIDTSLAWALPDGPAIETPRRVVVETKSPRDASDVDRLLWSLQHRPCSMSKYTTGLAALRSDLPANRWHPVLRRHFAESATGRTRPARACSAQETRP